MKMYLTFTFMFLYGLSASSQTKKPPVPCKNDETPKNQEKKEVHFCCPQCNFTDIKAGTCPADKIILVKEGIYYCTVCRTTNEKPCKCPKCNKDMIKMETPIKEANATPNKPEDKNKTPK